MPTELHRRSDKTTPENQPAVPSEEAIRDRAYHKYEERGREPGHDVDDWLEAERELQEPQKSPR